MQSKYILKSLKRSATLGLIFNDNSIIAVDTVYCPIFISMLSGRKLFSSFLSRRNTLSIAI